jgi:hypothetical protein
MNQVSLILYGVCVFVLLGYSVLTGWLQDISLNKKPVTGIFTLDLLLAFFPECFVTESGRLSYDVIAGMAVSASTQIIYEGSRQKSKFNQIVLGFYWWIAQFVAIGVATPLYFALYLQQDFPKEQYSSVPSIRTYISTTALLVTSVLNVFLEKSLSSKSPSSSPVNLLITWLFAPVVANSFIIWFDRNPSKQQETPAKPRFIQDFPFICGFLLGMLGHVKLLSLIFITQKFSLQDILTNPPSMFLWFDNFGLYAGGYLWIHFQKQCPNISAWTYAPLAIVFGPAAHFSLLCLLRERELDREVSKQRKRA